MKVEIETKEIATVYSKASISSNVLGEIKKGSVNTLVSMVIGFEETTEFAKIYFQKEKPLRFIPGYIESRFVDILPL